MATSAIPFASAAQTGKPRLRRKDCFLGFHFDLHPNLRDNALGRDVTEEMVEQFLAKTKPDYVQYDYKGHVGYVGYPSKISTSAPNVKDSLEIWRKVTARNGVALFIHFSGVLDALAVTDHPEWARVGPDGEEAGPRDRQETSTFGPYVDERMIPQLKEAITKYDVDGVWVDGECWGTKPDYSPAAARAWRAASGMQELPKKPGDPGWQQFLEFNRQQFRKYVKHYADVLHAFKPTFQIASNWLYTTYVPERPELPVDFLSGDYLGNASISTARLEARYLCSVGKPWDLMAWGFQSGAMGATHKPSVQLDQEASVVLAQGGGFQVYYQPTRAGKLDDRLVDVMAKVASFCRARQALSHQSESVPQIGLVLSKKSLYEYTPPAPTRPVRPGAPPPPSPPAPRLFGGWGSLVNPARGLLDALVESHYSVDVIPDWKLSEVAAQYPLVAVPDWANIGEEVKETLVQHVSKGGKLLLVGAANAALFGKELGVQLGEASEQPAYVAGEEVFGNVRGLWQDVEPGGAEVLASRYPTYDSTRDAKCAATLSKFGSGQIAAIYGPVGSVFALGHTAAVRQFIKRVVGHVLTPMVQVDAPPTVEMALRRKDGKLLVHLGNCTEMQVASDYAASDFVPPVGPVRISLRAAKKPERVTLEPQGRPLTGTWKEGVWTGTVDRLDVHAIVAFSV